MAKKPLTERQRNLRQIPFRLHKNDHKEVKSKTALDGFKIQTLVEACVLAYLDGDDYIKKLAHAHKSLNTVNKKKASWSAREQRNLLDEIENVITVTDDSEAE